MQCVSAERIDMAKIEPSDLARLSSSDREQVAHTRS